MRCVVAEEEEEGIVFVAMDEGDGIIGGDLGIMTYVGIVGILLDMDEAVAPEAVIRIVIGRIAVDGGDGPAIELVEAAMVGCRAWVVTVEMPFVHQTSAIACGADDLCDGGILWQEVSATHNGGIALGINLQTRETSRITLVVADTGIAAVTSRHQRTARGGADTTTGISLCETCARSCQTVDIRGLDISVSIARQITIAHIICQDEDDVRALGCRLLFRLFGSSRLLGDHRTDREEYLFCLFAHVLSFWIDGAKIGLFSEIKKKCRNSHEQRH